MSYKYHTKYAVNVAHMFRSSCGGEIQHRLDLENAVALLALLAIVIQNQHVLWCPVPCLWLCLCISVQESRIARMLRAPACLSLPPAPAVRAIILYVTLCGGGCF